MFETLFSLHYSSVVLISCYLIGLAKCQIRMYSILHIVLLHHMKSRSANVLHKMMHLFINICYLTVKTVIKNMSYITPCAQKNYKKKKIVEICSTQSYISFPLTAPPPQMTVYIQLLSLLSCYRIVLPITQSSVSTRVLREHVCCGIYNYYSLNL